MAKKITKLPMAHSLKLGTMNIRKGADSDGTATYAWDVGQKCRHAECPALPECHYEVNVESDGDCRVFRNYVRAASVVLYQDQVGLTTAERFQIGMHIIPLYKILCKMKIEEVGVRSVVSLTDRGSFQVHPIYKEIRETIKTIDQAWKSINMPKSKQPHESPFTSSSGNYYDKMEAAALDDMGN